MPAGVEKLLIVLAHWEKAPVQLGRDYGKFFATVHKFYASDVVRVEAFNAEGQPVKAKVDLRLSLAHIPTERVRVLRFSMLDSLHNDVLTPANAAPDMAALRTPVNNIEYFPPNFEGLVLGCIDADFCK